MTASINNLSIQQEIESLTASQLFAMKLMSYDPGAVFTCLHKGFVPGTARVLLRKGIVKLMDGTAWFPDSVFLTKKGQAICDQVHPKPNEPFAHKYELACSEKSLIGER